MENMENFMAVKIFLDADMLEIFKARGAGINHN
jgi:uncharacterized protein (DUF4415 family)